MSATSVDGSLHKNISVNDADEVMKKACGAATWQRGVTENNKYILNKTNLF